MRVNRNIVLELRRPCECACRHPESAAAERTLWLILAAGCEQRIAKFRIHCLFTVIHCSFRRVKIASFDNLWRGRSLRGIVRWSLAFSEKIHW